MHKRLTISIDEQVYEGLYSVVGRGNISAFIEALVRPHVISVSKSDLEAGYRAMAADEEYEGEAAEWIEGTLLEVADES